MTKVVYNACYGGFGLSHEAMLRYAELKGLTLYPEKTRFGLTTYWTAPKEARSEILPEDKFHSATQKAKIASNRAHKELTIYDRDISRTDPVLVQVVEELGEKANAQCANLQVEDITSGTRYRIDEYDGNESVKTCDDYDWGVA